MVFFCREHNEIITYTIATNNLKWWYWYSCSRDERRVHGLRSDQVVPGSGTAGRWYSVRTARWYLGNRLCLRRTSDQSTAVARRFWRRPALPYLSDAWYHSLFFIFTVIRLSHTELRTVHYSRIVCRLLLTSVSPSWCFLPVPAVADYNHLGGI